MLTVNLSRGSACDNPCARRLAFDDTDKKKMAVSLSSWARGELGPSDSEELASPADPCLDCLENPEVASVQDAVSKIADG